MTAEAIVALGIDGHPRGWVAVRLEDGRFAGAGTAPALATLLAEQPDAVAVGVDMPIGLPGEGTRACDEAARAFLGPRRSSVFPAPPAAVLEAADHAAASALSVRVSGKGISRQAWGLKDKIRELAALAGAPAELVEVHPECSFAALAGDIALPHPKTSWDGMERRRTLLAEVGIVLPADLGRAGAVPPVDVLDAAAAAWSAHRYAAGVAAPLPVGASPGDAMVIWR